MAEKKSTKKEIFAVVDLNGTQLLVKEGLEFEIKKLDIEKGTDFDEEKVLLIVEDEKVKIGKPYIKGAKVTFQVLSQTKGDKVVVFKYKAKSRYRKTSGTRPLITKILTKKIQVKAE